MDNIELFLQSKKNRNIKPELEKSINKCVSLKGAVAFWNFDIHYLKGLDDKLSHNNSFICVDIHQPTDIDRLKKFVEKGSNIYLFLYRSAKETQQPLLHTKLLLFDFPNNKAEIWIGSQNFTHSALEGSNFESTTIIPTKINSNLYNVVLSYLNSIKLCCEDIGKKTCENVTGKFNIDCVDFYKKLQGTYKYDGKDIGKMDVFCENTNIFESTNTILLSSNNNNEDQSNFVKNLKQNKFILHLKSKTNETHYHCSYTTEGIVDKIDVNFKGCILRDEKRKALFTDISSKQAMDLFEEERRFLIIIKIEDKCQEDMSFSKKQRTDYFWKKYNFSDDSPDTLELFDSKIYCWGEDEQIQIPKSQAELVPHPNEDDLIKNTEIIDELKEHYENLITQKMRPSKQECVLSKNEEQLQQDLLITEVRML